MRVSAAELRPGDIIMGWGRHAPVEPMPREPWIVDGVSPGPHDWTLITLRRRGCCSTLGMSRDTELRAVRPVWRPIRLSDLDCLDGGCDCPRCEGDDE